MDLTVYYHLKKEIWEIFKLSFWYDIRYNKQEPVFKNSSIKLQKGDERCEN